MASVTVDCGVTSATSPSPSEPKADSGDVSPWSEGQGERRGVWQREPETKQVGFFSK